MTYLFLILVSVLRKFPIEEMGISWRVLHSFNALRWHRASLHVPPSHSHFTHVNEWAID